MSGLLNSSLNGSSSNLPESSGRPFTSFSAQSGAASPAYHHTGIQGLHNIHGSYNLPNVASGLGSRNSSMNNVPSSGLQQSAGNISSGRYASSNIQIPLSQMSHGSSHGHSGMTSRGGMSVVGSPGYNTGTNSLGGSMPGIVPTSAAIGNRNAVPGLGVSPMLGNTGSRVTSSVGNMVGGSNIGRNMASGGGLSMPGLTSRLNLGPNSGHIPGQNRLMGGVLQQASPQVISMLGNSYPSPGGPLSQNHLQAANSLNSMSSDASPFDINDFPQLSSRPSSAGGPQGQIGSMRKQALGQMVQQNHEFSIQNEDFPALPGFKGGNAEYSMEQQQKEQVHDSSVSMIQPPQFSMGRSAGFNLGAPYSPHRPQQQPHTPSASSGVGSFSNINNQDLFRLHGSDMFPSSPSYHQQTGGHPGLGMRQLNSPSTVSSMGSYDQLYQQYQQHQNQSQFRLQQMSPVSQPFRDQSLGTSSMQAASLSDKFGLLGLLGVIRMSDPDLTSLALGMDLTSLGLNLNSSESLYKTFGSPWSDEPVKGDPEFTVPQCYYAKPPPPLTQAYFAKFQLDTLFYTFYSMPKDKAQLYAANELYNRGWFYHKEPKFWFMRVANMEPLIKTNSFERGSYICFDPNTWETIRKDNFVLHYEMVEKRPVLPQP